MSSFVNKNPQLTIWMQILWAYTFRPSRIPLKDAKMNLLGERRQQIRNGRLAVVMHEEGFASLQLMPRDSCLTSS
jgi:hypothetical protein